MATCRMCKSNRYAVVVSVVSDFIRRTPAAVGSNSDSTISSKLI